MIGQLFDQTLDLKFLRAKRPSDPAGRHSTHENNESQLLGGQKRNLT